MSTVKKISGAAIATIAAGMILSGGQALAGEGSTEAKVHCYGVNACKGQSACATADNSCKGHNSCKGKGWMPTSEAECEEKGGTVKE